MVKRHIMMVKRHITNLSPPLVSIMKNLSLEGAKSITPMKVVLLKVNPSCDVVPPLIKIRLSGINPRPKDFLGGTLYIDRN